MNRLYRSWCSQSRSCLGGSLKGPRPEGLARQRIACTCWVCLSGWQSQADTYFQWAEMLLVLLPRSSNNSTLPFAIASRWRSRPNRASSSLFSCRYYNGVCSDDQRVRVARCPTRFCGPCAGDGVESLGFRRRPSFETSTFSRMCSIQ